MKSIIIPKNFLKNPIDSTTSMIKKMDSDQTKQCTRSSARNCIRDLVAVWAESIYLSCFWNFYVTARHQDQNLLTTWRADQKSFWPVSLKSDHHGYLSGFIGSLGGVLVIFNFRSKRNDFWGLRPRLSRFLPGAHFFDDLSSFSKDMCRMSTKMFRRVDFSKSTISPDWVWYDPMVSVWKL